MLLSFVRTWSTQEPMGAVCRLDPLPNALTLPSKHMDTSSDGKPLHQPLQIADCTMPAHRLFHSLSCPLSSAIPHCAIFTFTIYAEQKKKPKIQCSIQATS